MGVELRDHVCPNARRRQQHGYAWRIAGGHRALRSARRMGLGGGSSAMWAHGGIWGDAAGPNSPRQGADDVMNCTQVQNASAAASRLGQAGMPCY